MATPENIQLGIFLRKARIEILPRMTQRAAATASGMNATLLSKFEAGERRPSPEQLERLAITYRVTPLFALGKAGYLKFPGFEDLLLDLDNLSNPTSSEMKKALLRLIDDASDDEVQMLMSQMIGVRLTRQAPAS